MASVSQADQDGTDVDDATIASQTDGAVSPNVAEDVAPEDEIQDFYLTAGDKIDLTDVVAYFGMSPEDVRDCLYFNELDRGTEIGIEVDGVPHKIVVVHGVTAAALCSVSPWIFDPSEVAKVGPTRDAPEAALPAAPDEFVFDPALQLPAPRALPPHTEPAEVSQLAEALGLSEAQVLEALNNNRILPDGTPLGDADTASAALSDADALVL